VSNIVLQVEDLWKQYRLGIVGTGTLRDDFARFWAKARGKEDPTLKIGNQNTLDTIDGDYVWALQDINFEVKQGEVLGIIGKNGAGKSTLLKILSKTTAPTKGNIKVRGKIASLLEVGTGFHPELTGRENVFLNGAILGMTKNDIRSKFDEIVAFSGVEKYIDTPVKRYSSGMYVRLAFAVAAHLEPEILIVDEVLAVGDADFQKKCLGKMKDVSGQGRTVLFVSHNMDAVHTLCNNGIYLKNGEIIYQGTAMSTVQKYLGSELSQRTKMQWTDKKPGDDVAELNYVKLIDENLNDINYVQIGEKIGIEYEYTIKKEGYQPIPNLHFFTTKGDYAFIAGEDTKEHHGKIGTHKAIAWLPKNLLNTQSYMVNIALSTLSPVLVHFNAQESLIFDVTEDLSKRGNDYVHEWPGIVRPKIDWQSTFKI
jgi:lipopolysaccharide transport system ATP-binding protein